MCSVGILLVLCVRKDRRLHAAATCSVLHALGFGPLIFGRDSQNSSWQLAHATVCSGGRALPRTASADPGPAGPSRGRAKHVIPVPMEALYYSMTRVGIHSPPKLARKSRYCTTVHQLLMEPTTTLSRMHATSKSSGSAFWWKGDSCTELGLLFCILLQKAIPVPVL